MKPQEQYLAGVTGLLYVELYALENIYVRIVSFVSCNSENHTLYPVHRPSTETAVL